MRYHHRFEVAYTILDPSVKATLEIHYEGGTEAQSCPRTKDEIPGRLAADHIEALVDLDSTLRRAVYTHHGIKATIERIQGVLAYLRNMLEPC